MEEHGLTPVEPSLDSTQSNEITDELDPSTANDYENSPILARNVMDNYLKKHKLDLKILPNKKMIKLSDLTSSFYSTSPSLSATQDAMDRVTFSKNTPQSLLSDDTNEIVSNKIALNENSELSLNERISQECEDFYDDDYDDDDDDEEGDDDEEDEEEDGGEDEDEEEDDEDDYDDDFLDDEVDFVENYRTNEKENEDALNVTSESTTNSVQDFKIYSNETNGIIFFFLRKFY